MRRAVWIRRRMKIEDGDQLEQCANNDEDIGGEINGVMMSGGVQMRQNLEKDGDRK